VCAKEKGDVKTEGKSMKTKQDLIRKAKKDWKETWNEAMIDYDAESNLYTVYVGRMDVYKAFFNANTLQCVGTKC